MFMKMRSLKRLRPRSGYDVLSMRTRSSGVTWSPNRILDRQTPTHVDASPTATRAVGPDARYVVRNEMLSSPPVIATGTRRAPQ